MIAHFLQMISEYFAVTSSIGILAVLAIVVAGFFFAQQWTRWKLFDYLPPLIFIYFVPVVLTNIGVLPSESGVYDTIGELFLPMLLVMLLLKVDVASAIRVMGSGILVMLVGTLGVVLGAPVAYFIVRGYLEPDAWKAFGILAGSWIGGTGNMAAVTEMLEESTKGTNFGLAVLGDTVIYIGWLPLLLVSRKFANQFSRFSKVDKNRLEQMEAAAAEATLATPEPAPRFQDHLYVLATALIAAWFATVVSQALPSIGKVITAGTWKVLIVTTLGISLSFTPLRRLAGSHQLAMALLYFFVARMGASADLTGVASQATPFLIGCTIWIVIHGLFCLLGARLFRVDVHTAAIASAANIGGAASAPIVAAHHRESLVPVSILMALVGYAVGNYAAFLAALLCQALAPGG